MDRQHMQAHDWRLGNYVESDCTITFDGHAYTSGGAVVTEDRIVAYPADGGVLHDWHGRQIGTWRVIGSRPAVFFGYRSWVGDRYYYMRANVNGREYSMRGFGTGMVAMGKRLTSRG